MADLRSICGADLDNADHAEIKNIPWIKFAARTYQRECEDAADEAVADYDCDHKRVSRAEVSRTYDQCIAAEARRDRLVNLGIDFCSFRELIDAEIEADKLCRIFLLAHAARKFDQKYPVPRPRRLKTAPAKFVRVNGVKIPRSKSHVPC